MPEKTPKPRTYEYNKEYAKVYAKKQIFFKLRLTQEQKNAIDEAAKKAGESINSYILKAVQARIDGDFWKNRDKLF